MFRSSNIIRRTFLQKRFKSREIANINNPAGIISIDSTSCLSLLYLYQAVIVFKYRARERERESEREREREREEVGRLLCKSDSCWVTLYSWPASGAGEILVSLYFPGVGLAPTV